MLTKLVRAAAILAALVGPATAQIPLTIPTNNKPPPTAEEMARQRALDNAYTAATKKIPDKKPVADPWADVRPHPATASKNKQ